MGFNIGSVFLTLLADGARLEADITKQALSAADKAGQKAGKTLGQQLATGLSKAGKTMQSVGTSLTRNLTLPIVAAGAAIVKTGIDFDTTLRQIVALTDTTADEIGGIRSQILDLAKVVGKDPTELARGFYFLASAGFDTAQALDILTQTAKASAAGLGETSDISKVVGAAINAFGKENLTATDAVDQLIRAVKDGAAEAPDFASSLGDVISVAASMGATFADTSAAIAAMTLTGVDANTASTNLGQVLSSLLKPTTQAEGALKEMGLSSAGLRQELKEKGLLSLLQTLQAKFEGNDTAASTVFGNIRALRGVLALLGLDSKQLAGIFDDVNSGTANLGQAFADTEGPGRELDRAFTEIKTLLIDLSTDVLPGFLEVLRTAVGLVRTVAGAFKSLPPEVRGGIVQLAGFAAVLGPTLLVLGKLSSGVGAVIGAFSKLSGSRVVGAAASAVSGVWSGVASSSVVSGAVAAAGNAASTLYLKALIAGDAVVAGLTSLWAKAVTSVPLLGTISKAGASIGTALATSVVAALAAGIGAFFAGIEISKWIKSQSGMSEQEWQDAVYGNYARMGGRELPPEVRAASNEIGKRIERDIGDGIMPASTVERAGDDMMAKLRAAVPGTVAKEAGQQIPKDIATGISERQSFVQGAMQNLRNLMENVLGRKKRIGLVIGDLISEDLQKALNDRRGRVRKAAAQTQEALLAELEKSISRGGKVGEDAMDALRDAMHSKNPKIRTAAQRVYDIVTGKLNATVKPAGDAGTAAGNAFARGLRNATVGGFVISGTVKSFGTPGRATGGPVVAGMPYLVNERTARSEIFVPSVSGQVVTHADAVQAIQSGVGGGGDTYNIPVNVQGALPVRTPRDVVTELRRIGELGLLPAATLSPKYRRREAQG